MPTGHPSRHDAGTSEAAIGEIDDRNSGGVVVAAAAEVVDVEEVTSGTEEVAGVVVTGTLVDGGVGAALG